MNLRELLNYDHDAARHFALDLLRTPLTAANRWRLKAQKSPILGYIGWVGHNNLGDEAMFERVRKAFHGFTLIPLLPEPGERLISRWNVGPGVFDAVLLGGGTLINCEFAALARFVRQSQVPIYSVGTGVGSPGFGTKEGTNCLDCWRDALHELRPLSVRGPISRDLPERAGIPDVQVIGDPALGLTPGVPPPFRTRQRLIINLSRESSTQDENGNFHVFRTVAELAADFFKGGGEVVGIALGDHDRSTLESFRTTNHFSAMRIEDHRHSSRRFFDTVVGSVALIGVRLHSAVLASCIGVPAILFAYRSKCLDFMSSMDLEDFALPFSAGLSPPLLRSRFQRILAESHLSERIYQKAVFWKAKQDACYRELQSQIQAASKNVEPRLTS